jgi:peptide deformylase
MLTPPEGNAPPNQIRFAADRGELRLLHYPKDAGLLRRKARQVRDDEFGTEPFEKFCRELASLMMGSHGVGLSSTQVEQAPGGEPWAVFAMRVNDESVGIFCNPEVVKREGKVLDREGCLSFASIGEVLPAPEHVLFAFKNMRGTVGQVLFSDRYARAVAHEIDHLNGKLIVDRMSSMKKQMFLGAVGKRYRALAQAASATREPSAPSAG